MRGLGNRRGATAIECALIACCVSITIVSTVTAVSNNMMTMFYEKLVNFFSANRSK
jgi:Flp pilus assembly pilin Flp